jgi:hypothetical protein
LLEQELLSEQQATKRSLLLIKAQPKLNPQKWLVPKKQAILRIALSDDVCMERLLAFTWKG